MWTIKTLYVFTSVLTWLFPYGVFAVYFITKRHSICEKCIAILCFKFLTEIVISKFDFGFPQTYACDIDGQVYKMSHFNKTVVVMFSFFAYLALN